MDSQVRNFTPAEAATISGIAVKAVHNAIDKDIVHSIETVGQGRLLKRRLTREAILELKLWYGVGASLSASRRQRLFDEIKAKPLAKTVKADDLLIVDVEEARRQIARNFGLLQEAEAAVEVRKEVLGGMPVFRGTRIPVRLIAEMLEQGATSQELLEGYPKLGARDLELAKVWAKAHPAVGRPKKAPADGFQLKSRKLLKLFAETPVRRGGGK